MNGVHDMGGMHGFGTVLPEPNEPVFHAQWEARVFAAVRGAGVVGGCGVPRGYRVPGFVGGLP